MNHINKTSPSVAIITSTLGRASLEQSILSVQQQSYPCVHYVFVDGAEYAATAEQILRKYPDVKAMYLPCNTGKNGWDNSYINAASAYLVKEDIICYVDDDNTLAPHHVQSIVQTFQNHACDYVYSLRYLMNSAGQIISPDHVISVGELPRENVQREFVTRYQEKAFLTKIEIPEPLIDTNCYAFPRALAMHLSPVWARSYLQNDLKVFRYLREQGFKGQCTHQYSVNYLFNPRTIIGGVFDALKPKLGDELAALAVEQILVQLN
ncbi:MAG: glycosyltransferase [Acinetobacter sp.]|nr:glycosyltransferase [Acinetobacter sp.]